MTPTGDALYDIHAYQAGRRGRCPLGYAEFCDRVSHQSETDLTQLLDHTPTAMPAWKVDVRVLPSPGPKVTLGQIHVTPEAAKAVPTHDVVRALSRHASGDWGVLKPEDRRQNELALAHHGRLLSIHRAQNGCRFYVITDPGWRCTTVLLPQDY